MLDPAAKKIMRREALRVDTLYHHVYFARNHAEYDYGRIFRSDRGKDEKEICAVYHMILRVLNGLGPRGAEIRGWKAVLLSRLAELESNYEEKLKIIDRAIAELESSFLVCEYLYEYVDLCLRKGVCLVERREKPETVEELYDKADRAIRMYGTEKTLPKPFCGLNRRMQLETLPDWLHLRCKFYMAVASFRLDVYDRTREREKPLLQLIEAKRCLIRAEALLKKIGARAEDIRNKENAPRNTENAPAKRKNAPPGFNVDCLGGGSLRFTPAAGRFDRDKVVNLTYLSTRAFYHLKELEYGDLRRLDEVLSALELYLGGFLYDLRNTISMGNIAYICYLFADDPGFRKKLRERTQIRLIYEEFPKRLKQELKSRLTLEAVCFVLEEILEKIKKDIWEEILKAQSDFRRVELCCAEFHLPTEMIRGLWLGSGRFAGLNAMTAKLENSGDGQPAEAGEIWSLWEGLFSRLFGSGSPDGFEPRPLLPRGIRPADQMAEDNREIIRQIVKGKMDDCWEELDGRLAALSKRGMDAYVRSGYAVCLRGPAGDVVQVTVERARGTRFPPDGGSLSSDGGESYRDEWPLFYNENACAMIAKRTEEICAAVCRSACAAAGAASPAYDLLDWIFTIAREA